MTYLCSLLVLSSLTQAVLALHLELLWALSERYLLQPGLYLGPRCLWYAQEHSTLKLPFPCALRCCMLLLLNLPAFAVGGVCGCVCPRKAGASVPSDVRAAAT